MATFFPARRRTDRSTDSRALDSLRALVVDDDANYLAWIAALVARAGFEVLRADDGAVAAAAIGEQRYDLVIVDQEMPRMKGTELIGLIRGAETTQGAYALMLTGREDVPTKLEALRAGFDDFIRKSESEEEIAASVVAARRVVLRQRALDRAAQELYGLATRDELTGLFNRRFLLAEAEKMLAAGPMALILFDLDGFKKVNDSLGHVFGDRVLRDVGAALQAVTRPDDVVARYGGDEFVMLVPRHDVPAAERIAERILETVRALRWPAGTLPVAVGATVGIARSAAMPEPSVSRLLEVADRELYARKRAQVPRLDPPGTRALL